MKNRTRGQANRDVKGEMLKKELGERVGHGRGPGERAILRRPKGVSPADGWERKWQGGGSKGEFFQKKIGHRKKRARWRGGTPAERGGKKGFFLKKGRKTPKIGGTKKRNVEV